MKIHNTKVPITTDPPKISEWDKTSVELDAIRKEFIILHNIPKANEQIPITLTMLRRRCVEVHERRIAINMKRLKEL